MSQATREPADPRERADQPWLVVIDMQAIFGDPASQWFTPRFAEIVPAVQQLIASFGERVVFTRFVAPETPDGAWRPYYAQWPFALDPGNAHLYELVPDLADDTHAVVDREALARIHRRTSEVRAPIDATNAP